tara:strand:+ start:775 stop:945 length:171 start_codon:yes stop_codon:yes gene_type:complete
MDIKEAKYCVIENRPKYIQAVIDGQTCSVPIEEGNRHYDEIMRQVADKKLTIKEAD